MNTSDGAVEAAPEIQLDPRDQSPEDFFLKTGKLGLSDSTARRWLGAVIGRGQLSPNEWGQDNYLPKRIVLASHQLPQLSLERQQTSLIDGFQKLLFRTTDGLAVETVLIPLHKEGSVSVCLSSQVGCVMGCVFCATARMTERRNLRTWEIVDQMSQARAIAKEQGRRVTGAVFMGMGEPFLNYDRVMAAAELMRYPLEGAISAKAITVSTVGLVGEIERFTQEQRAFRLSISLGAATDEKRRKLVPVAARTPIADLMAAAARYAASRKTRINLAYVCIKGENTGEEDARELAAVVGDTPVRLDLIDVTDTSGRFQRCSDEEMKLFRDALSKYLKQPVVRRYSGGADIQAACGTLAGSRD